MSITLAWTAVILMCIGGAILMLLALSGTRDHSAEFRPGQRLDRSRLPRHTRKVSAKRISGTVAEQLS